MLTSVITHPALSALVIIRASYVGVCANAPDSACAAGLLAVFEYWLNKKISNRIDHAARNAALMQQNPSAAVQGLPHADETGGLSGRPVFEASNRVIAQLRAALGATYPIIGVGGVMSAADAAAKRAAGADLVQIYTGLIYGGPALVPACARALKG